ncbi:MAG TPA: alpha/beta hydrolase [Chloroflexia bacterium]|nr:alpha/beta hydrolase [Chloroflexia bacterium]
MGANLPSYRTAPRDGYIPVGGAALYYRETGRGHPVVVLHGGPEFDHTYLLPDLDLLADSYRLIYYDQRGRGRSAEGVRPEDVTVRSEVEDIEHLREHFGLESVAVLGHSWGGLLALEYATHHPERVSHLILLNTAPVSHGDYLFLRQELPEKRTPDDLERLKAFRSTAGYEEGDPDTFAAYCRIHFKPTIRQPEHLESVVERLRASFTKEGVLRARAIEGRLAEQTWLVEDYDLLPALRRLNIPTLVLHGDYDFIPVECAEHVARAIPGARFALLEDCGHFSFIERPEQVRAEIAALFRGS